MTFAINPLQVLLLLQRTENFLLECSINNKQKTMWGSCSIHSEALRSAQFLGTKTATAKVRNKTLSNVHVQFLGNKTAAAKVRNETFTIVRDQNGNRKSKKQNTEKFTILGDKNGNTKGMEKHKNAQFLGTKTATAKVWKKTKTATAKVWKKSQGNAQFLGTKMAIPKVLNKTQKCTILSDQNSNRKKGSKQKDHNGNSKSTKQNPEKCIILRDQNGNRKATRQNAKAHAQQWYLKIPTHLKF